MRLKLFDLSIVPDRGTHPVNPIQNGVRLAFGNARILHMEPYRV